MSVYFRCLANYDHFAAGRKDIVIIGMLIALTFILTESSTMRYKRLPIVNERQYIQAMYYDSNF